MNPFSYYITELFEQPFPVREYKRLGYGPATAEITYHAQDEQGRDLMIDITNVGGGWEINFTIDGSHDLTHSGKPFRVLATVVKAVEVFLKWHKDEFDTYPASFDMISKRSESKRDVVYSALMQRFGKKYGYKIADTFVTNRNARPEDQRTVTTAKLEESANPSTAQPKPEYFQKPFSISGKIVQLYQVWDVPVKSKSYHNKIGRAALRAWERTGRAVRANEMSPGATESRGRKQRVAVACSCSDGRRVDAHGLYWQHEAQGRLATHPYGRHRGTNRTTVVCTNRRNSLRWAHIWWTRNRRSV